MRIAISHTTTYHYARPAKDVIQMLRVTPRNNGSQHVVRWRAEVTADVRLRQSEDAFGNIVHALNAPGPIESFAIHVDGEVDTIDTAGVQSGGVERFPNGLYLRATDLTTIDPAMADFARAVRHEARGGDQLALLHALMRTLNQKLRFDTGATQTSTTAADAFAGGHGVCQDYTHIFCAMARHLGVPARYISGYFLRADGVTEQEAGHAWAEAYVEGLGWVGFDSANGVCASEAHVRVAMALDALGAAPVRGSQVGGAAERLDVAIKVFELPTQS